MGKEEKIDTLVRSIFRKYDLSTEAFKDTIDEISQKCKDIVEECPDIEVNNFFIMQMILETY